MEFAIANKKLSEDFGLANVHMILTDAHLDADKAVDLASDLKNITGIKSVLSLEAVIGNQAPAEALPESVANLTKSDQHELTLAVSEYRTATPEMTTQINQLNETIKKYDTSALLVGEASLTQDMHSR